jgi:hypothetical protein
LVRAAIRDGTEIFGVEAKETEVGVGQLGSTEAEIKDSPCHFRFRSR